MIEHLNIINALNDQISALLDLIMLSEDGVDSKSIKTAAEMCLTMQMELMSEVDAIKKKWRESKESEDDLK